MNRANGLETSAQLIIRNNWIVMLLAMTASSLTAVTLGQDVSWDLQNYHYYAGYAFLHKPLNYDFAPAQMQSFFNPLMHVVSYLLLAHLPSRMAAAVFGAIQGLNFYVIFLISLILFRRWQNPNRFLISLGSAFTGFYGAANISELGTTIGDNLASILVLSGLLIIIRYLPSEKSSRYHTAPLWIGGVILGAAAGIKLTFAIYAAAVFFSVLLLPLRKRFRQFAILGAALATGFIATYAIWGINLYLQYQNPFFPYLNNIFHSPFYDKAGAFDDRFLPRNWQHILFYPFFIARKNHLVSELDLRDVRLALCYIAVVLLAGTWITRLLKQHGRAHRHSTAHQEDLILPFLLAFISLSYAMWQYLFSIYRYQIVLELLAPAFLAAALAHFGGTERRSLICSLAVYAYICLSVISPNWGRQEFDDDFLKVHVPPIKNLEKCVVLMAGADGTSFIVPQFPSSTRFVRVYSNLASPGRNPNIDRKIFAMLAPYDADRILLYVANLDELDHTRDAVSFYGVAVDDRACFEVKSGAANKSYLCRAVNGWSADEKKPPALPWNRPEFQEDSTVRLTITPKAAVAGKDSIMFQVVGTKSRAIDMLYTSNGMCMPPIRGHPLDSDQTARVFVPSISGKGLYHYVGIRASGEKNKNLWYHVDATLLIK
jgi:hypothetical protein